MSGPIATARAHLAELLGHLDKPVLTSPPATVSPPCLAILEATPALVPAAPAGHATASFEVLALPAPSRDAATTTARLDEMADSAFVHLHHQASIAQVRVEDLGTVTLADGQPHAAARLSVSLTVSI